MIQLSATGKRVTTNGELLLKAIEANNKRVSIEWDQLGDVDGNSQAAIQLATMQGIRSVRLMEKYGYHYTLKAD